MEAFYFPLCHQALARLIQWQKSTVCVATFWGFDDTQKLNYNPLERKEYQISCCSRTEIMGLVESPTCFWLTRTFNSTSTRLGEKLCLYKSKICQSLMTGNNKDVILDTIPQRLLSCHRTIRKSFPRLIWKRFIIIKIIVKCQSIPCHYCFICSVSGDSHMLQFDFPAATTTGHTLFFFFSLCRPRLGEGQHHRHNEILSLSPFLSSFFQ